MTYRFDSLSIDVAESALAAVKNGETLDIFNQVKEIGEGEKFECRVEGLAEKLLTLWRGEFKGVPKSAKFESEALVLIHSTLGIPTFVGGHREFWTWLTFAADRGSFLEVVAERYGIGSALVNFGIATRAKIHEGLFAKLWTRAEHLLDEENDDPYHLARRGDIDFWSSHFFKQDFATCKPMSRALVEFCFPEAGQISSKYDTLFIRRIVKLAQARNAVTSFELLTQQECLEIWNQISDGLGDFDGKKWKA
ncbi:hypothetical protein N8606_01560 [Akkermansiaceae bacterium]|nr:hypothetical protein [Akkermansiaceae bacterium]MDA8971866.1 hypothetical protein [bacterium]MDB4781136.1 hypothetical protein [Akkermansiaceae bacterium]